jgi:hypothetical protein
LVFMLKLFFFTENASANATRVGFATFAKARLVYAG